MVKAIVICGPTATGKTALAVKLAAVYGGELISADSRQIFTGMDIGTGKDLPEPFFHIWGYDLVTPDHAFHVADYYRYVASVLPGIISRGHLPIIVGGTGFYLLSLIAPFATQTIPPNESLRHKLSHSSVSNLQSLLQGKYPAKWQQLNLSDRGNPRRLIRALETGGKAGPLLPSLINPLLIGLTMPLPEIDVRIHERVLLRATSAFTLEVKDMLATYPVLSPQAASATGYREWIAYINGFVSRDEAIKRWEIRERQYARRQLTWFKKQRGIAWFKATDPLLVKRVVEKVNSWYAT